MVEVSLYIEAHTSLCDSPFARDRLENDEWHRVSTVFTSYKLL